MTQSPQIISSPRAYPHRKNDDGTYDSICPYCIRTVGSSDSESALAFHEQNHLSDPDDIREMGGTRSVSGINWLQ